MSSRRASCFTPRLDMAVRIRPAAGLILGRHVLFRASLVRMPLLMESEARAPLNTAPARDGACPPCRTPRCRRDTPIPGRYHSSLTRSGRFDTLSS